MLIEHLRRPALADAVLQAAQADTIRLTRLEGGRLRGLRAVGMAGISLLKRRAAP